MFYKYVSPDGFWVPVSISWLAYFAVSIDREPREMRERMDFLNSSFFILTSYFTAR